jgi:hypothetical protein
MRVGRIREHLKAYLFQEVFQREAYNTLGLKP